MRVGRMIAVSIGLMLCASLCSGCIGGLVGILTFAAAAAQLAPDARPDLVAMAESGASGPRSFNFEHYAVKYEYKHLVDPWLVIQTKRARLSTTKRNALLLGISAPGKVRGTPLVGYTRTNFTVEVDGVKDDGQGDLMLLGGEFQGDIGDSNWYWRYRYLSGYGSIDLGPLPSAFPEVSSRSRTSQIMVGIGVKPIRNLDLNVGIALDTAALPAMAHINDSLTGGDNAYRHFTWLFGVSYKF